MTPPTPPHNHSHTQSRFWRKPLKWIAILAMVVVIFRITGCMERLFFYPVSGPTTPPPEFAQAESVLFTSADGTRLHGWFIPTEDPTQAPTIVHVHGNAGNIESHIGFTEFLPEAGFNLLIFDYRGYGQSEGSARKRADLIADTHAALDYLQQREDIDTRRIGMFGQSLGGSITLTVLAQRDDVKAAVIMAAFSSWREMAASAVSSGRPGLISRGLATCFISDQDRPVDAISQIRTPILLIHGTADSIIPVAHGRQLAEAASSSVEYLEIAGGDHNDLRWTHPHVDDEIVRFLRRHLTSTDSTPAAEPES